MKHAKIILTASVLFAIGISSFVLISTILDKERNLPETAQRDPKVREAYMFAMEHPEILSQIPCFCGCVNLAHKNNLDCFLDINDHFVSHGSTCGGCVGVALDAKRLYLEGKSVKEIRYAIDQKYSSQHASLSTNTPPVGLG